MTSTTDAPIRLTAEDVEFVPGRPYVAWHGCGSGVLGLGRDMHDAIVAHTADCDWKEPSA